MKTACRLGCEACEMVGERAPDEWRTGIPEPVVRFVRDVRSPSGEVMLAADDTAALLEVQMPVFMSVLRNRVGSLAVAERWPTLRGQIEALLRDGNPSNAVAHGEPLGERSQDRDDPLRCIVFAVILPIPSGLLSDPAAALTDRILPQVEEAVVDSIRTYQMARRVGMRSGA